MLTKQDIAYMKQHPIAFPYKELFETLVSLACIKNGIKSHNVAKHMFFYALTNAEWLDYFELL